MTSDDVTSSSVFTLNAAHVVDLDSSSSSSSTSASVAAAASCVYINSSQPVLVAQLSHVTAGGGASMSLLPALAQLADNYTLVAFRRQYDDDQQVTDRNTLHYAVP